MRFMTGIELTSRLTPQANVADVHVLGYAFDHENLPESLKRGLCKIQASQRRKIKKRCATSLRDPIIIKRKDDRSLAVQMDFDDLLIQLEQAGRPKIEYGSYALNEGIMCTPLIPIINEFLGIFTATDGITMHMIVNIIKGYPVAYDEIQKFLSRFGARLSQNDEEPRVRWYPEGFTPFFFEASDSIDMIKEAEGVAVVAHPGEGTTGHTRENIKTLQGFGAQGLEVYSSKHTKEQVRAYLEIALDLELFRTIGTDFHGEELNPNLTVGKLLYCEDYPAAFIDEIETLANGCLRI